MTGRLADFDRRALRAESADARILATARGGGGGIARISVSIAGRRVATTHPRCRPKCPGSETLHRDLHEALNSAARGFHDHRRGGSVTIVYAASNALLGAGGNGDQALTAKTAHEAGRRQALTLRGLQLDSHETAAVGGDIEPGYDLIAPPKVSVSLVAGAVSVPKLGRPYYDVGTAPCSGDKCTNGWSLRRDICAVASGPGRRALPEIYYGPPLDQAKDWTAAAKACNIHAFAGASGEKSADYTPAQSWRVLRDKAKAGVGRVLVVFPE